MKAVVMSIGSELLGGFLTDTNATFLAQDMAAVGIDLVGVMQVGDDLERIAHVIGRATEDAELVVITGGVGPTEDDLTREAIARFTNEEVYVDTEQLEIVQRFFASRGTPMPERNQKQAWLIPSAEALPNPVGTAPGWLVRHGDHIIVSMPGVPREMTRMWREQVIPRLADRLGSVAIVSTTVKTIGIGESAAEDMVSDIIHRGNPVVATYAKNDGVHIRISASDSSQARAEELVRKTESEVIALFGPHYYGDLETGLGEAILRHFQRRGIALHVAEAGSAGRTANLLAEETELAGWFAGGTIEHFRDAARRLGIDAEQEDAPLLVARAMASSGSASTTSALLAVTARIGDPVDGERRNGEMGYCLNLNGELYEHTSRVAVNPGEIRRRAALVACEFLHVTMGTI